VANDLVLPREPGIQGCTPDVSQTKRGLPGSWKTECVCLDVYICVCVCLCWHARMSVYLRSFKGSSAVAPTVFVNRQFSKSSPLCRTEYFLLSPHKRDPPQFAYNSWGKINVWEKTNILERSFRSVGLSVRPFDKMFSLPDDRRLCTLVSYIANIIASCLCFLQVGCYSSGS